jgi:CRP/FNR family cyclic AMP-dependent transcriptional regulator
MACDPELLKQVPLFAQLDNDEAAVLAGQVEVRNFAPRQRIYKIGDTSGRGYIVVSGKVLVSTIDESGQEVPVDESGPGDFFGFASMLEQTPHQTEAVAQEASVCVEVDRHDILILLTRKPDAGMDMLQVLGRQFHASQHLVRLRAYRNPNQLIEEQATLGERMADAVASFGGSWKFITSFALFFAVYTIISHTLGAKSWDPYPFILLNLFLSMLAAIQAPVIMMSQNRQDKKDRLRGELDYEVNRHAHRDIQGLAHKLNGLADRLGDIEDALRQRG